MNAPPLASAIGPSDREQTLLCSKCWLQVQKIFVKTVLEYLMNSSQDTPPCIWAPSAPADGEEGGDGEQDDIELFRAIREKCNQIEILILQTKNPGEAGWNALTYLRKDLEYRFELLWGRKRAPMIGRPECAEEARRLTALVTLWGDKDPA